MLEHLPSIFLAVLGLGFLVFIHELGHYWVARRVGMKVEVFSIGFGRPIKSWLLDGVKWQVGWLPFGGYVKIAGMQKEGTLEPHEIEGGFFNRTPWQRIQVALMGPLVNIAFACVAFAAIWLSGGREKTFSEFTRHIGWIDPKSALYAQGVRPGDLIEAYDGHSFRGFNDLLIAGMTSSAKEMRIQGYKLDHATGKQVAFDYMLPSYQDAHMPKDKVLTIGIVSSANYVFYQEKKPETKAQPGTLSDSGIEPSDRILWADGELIFSTVQLNAIVNESTTFLTVQRGDEIFQTKVPRIHLDELKTTPTQRAEIDDWQHEGGLRGRVEDLYFIPYLLTPGGEVESRLSFIDEADQESAFERCERCSYFHPLKDGDTILAVDGQPVASSYDLLHQLQQRRVLLIVQRNPELTKPVDLSKAEREFDDTVDFNQLESIVSAIGTSHPVKRADDLYLLKPVIPRPRSEQPLTPEQRSLLESRIVQAKKEIAAIKDPQRRDEANREFEQDLHRLVLGFKPEDRPVLYNPSPLEQLSGAFQDAWRALKSIGAGKNVVAGPVGIVQVVEHSWTVGFKEGIFWMGIISLNLGILNLLPLPVLDGGHIAASLFEMITRRRISAKVWERMIIPFVGLLVAFIIYVTYNDLSRLFSHFF